MSGLLKIIPNTEELNEYEKKKILFSGNTLIAQRFQTKTFKSSYDKKYYKISSEGLRFNFNPNNSDPVYGDDCLDSLFFFWTGNSLQFHSKTE